MFVNRFRPIAGKTNLPEPRNLPRREMPARQAPRRVNPREAGFTTREALRLIVCGAAGTTISVMGFSAAHYMIKETEEIPEGDCFFRPAQYRSSCGGHYHNNYHKEIGKSLTDPAFAYEHVLGVAVEGPFSGTYVMGAFALFGSSLTATYFLYLLAESISEKIGSLYRGK